MYRIVLPVDGDDQREVIIRETMKNINYILFVSSTPNAEIYIQFRQLKP